MATTDAKTGFRLPWSPDRGEPSESSDAVAQADQAVDAVQPDVASPDLETETPPMIDAVPAATAHVAAVDPVADTTPDAAPAAATAPAPGPAVAPRPSTEPARKPNKFMADLTKAMQAAAESARTESIERFAAEAKTHIEGVHAGSANEATDLRKRADDDVASIREWSKAEIARIREETDERITHRKSKLEQEIDAHAAAIEQRIERIQSRVAGFEAEMAEFFERLLAETDPTRFAAMAQSLPEPPPFDTEAWSDAALEEAMQARAPEVASTPVAQGEAEAVADVQAAESEPVAEATETAELLAAEAPAADATWQADAPTQDAAPDADLFSIGRDTPAQAGSSDPRLSALGLDTDFAAAEAEAAAFTPGDGSDDEIPVIADDALAARLAGLVPETGEATTEASDASTTRVIVQGLISVASIAGFKRQLSRVAGVASVGVSSGPDGEFVFVVAHDAGASLRDAIPGLTGFGARVTGDADGELQVTARDPESET
ncbi:MAG TPA: hypothetical protein VD763_06335 [Candidatus Saccharimonadales bacterium]|nr:hypothetical protein [Candidatus Saccharimonadales bacterium]